MFRVDPASSIQRLRIAAWSAASRRLVYGGGIRRSGYWDVMRWWSRLASPFPGRERDPAGAICRRALEGIETQPGHALPAVLSVASEAVLRKDRPDLAIVIHPAASSSTKPIRDGIPGLIEK